MAPEWSSTTQLSVMCNGKLFNTAAINGQDLTSS